MAQHRTDHGYALYAFAGRHGPTNRVTTEPPPPRPTTGPDGEINPPHLPRLHRSHATGAGYGRAMKI